MLALVLSNAVCSHLWISDSIWKTRLPNWRGRAWSCSHMSLFWLLLLRMSAPTQHAMPASTALCSSARRRWWRPSTYVLKPALSSGWITRMLHSHAGHSSSERCMPSVIDMTGCPQEFMSFWRTFS